MSMRGAASLAASVLLSLVLAACSSTAHTAPLPETPVNASPSAMPAPEPDEASAKAALAAPVVPQSVDFRTGVLPILQSRCQPCHFEGGAVYASMPFDRPQTLRTLGNKLFTRIRKPEEQNLIRSFLEQAASPEPLAMH